MESLSNSPTDQDLTDWDRDHNLHPWAGVEGFGSDEYMRVNSADGVHIWDTQGKRYSDCGTGDADALCLSLVLYLGTSCRPGAQDCRMHPR